MSCLLFDVLLEKALADVAKLSRLDGRPAKGVADLMLTLRVELPRRPTDGWRQPCKPIGQLRAVV